MKRIAAVVTLLALVAVVLSGCGGTDTLFKQGRFHLDEGIKLMVDSAELYQAGDQAGSADAFTKAQAQLQQAINRFEEVLARDPEKVGALVNLGAAYYNLNQLDKAIAQYERALVLEPADAGIHANLAAAQFQKGDVEKAMAEYQLAVDLEPGLAEAHFGLGVLYMEQEMRDRAIEAFEEFQRVDRGTDPTASALAELHLKDLKGQ